jgi:hypothetical protein
MAVVDRVFKADKAGPETIGREFGTWWDEMDDELQQEGLMKYFEPEYLTRVRSKCKLNSQVIVVIRFSFVFK